MDYKEVTAQLVQGSRNINQMKGEIDVILKMLMGYIKIHGKHLPKGYTYVWTADHGQWVMKGFNPALIASKDVNIEYEVSTVAVYNSRGGATPMKAEYVEAVYDDLSYLVQGVITQVPKIQELLEPFMRASKRTL